jgi:hypothetical protein
MTKNINERELSKVAGGVDVQQVTDRNPTPGVKQAPGEPGDPNTPDVFSADAESGASNGPVDLSQGG